MIWKTQHLAPGALKSPDAVYRSCTDPNALGKTRRPVSFAVVGGGPKGYYAVERLAHALSRKGRLAEAAIHWFNTDRWFGCGGNFRPDQPECLLVNNSIGTINAAALPGDRNPLVNWINRHRLVEYPTASYVDFASRTLVGHYLSDTVFQFLSRLPEEGEIRLVIGGVTNIVRTAGHLRIHVTQGGNEMELPVAYQNVMLATGHSYSQPLPEWAAFAATTPGVVYIPDVYPIKNLNRVPAGKPVAVQGLGLTLIDTVLALTEGRGGVFLEEAGSLRYIPSGREPATIFPFSRSNLPTLARSPVGAVDRYPLRFLTARWATNLRNNRGGEVCFETDILPVLEREMTHAYHRTKWRDFDSSDTVMGRRIASLDANDRFSIERFLFGTFPLQETKGESPQKRMLRYLKIGLAEAGKREWESPVMAAAGVWRKAVPIIRALYTHGGFSGDAHRVFAHRYYGALNRVAFGPPAANMQKVCCLAEAGHIRFPFGAAPQVHPDRRARMFVISDGSERVDVPVLIDARIARPDLDAGNSRLYANLLAAGLVRPMENGGFRPGCAALSITGCLLGVDGQPTGIAVYGTPTEGATLDNDSLSPSCNDLATPWAESVVASMTPQHAAQYAKV